MCLSLGFSVHGDLLLSSQSISISKKPTTKRSLLSPISCYEIERFALTLAVYAYLFIRLDPGIIKPMILKGAQKDNC